jgi:hypothetical protein
MPQLVKRGVEGPFKAWIEHKNQLRPPCYADKDVETIVKVESSIDYILEHLDSNEKYDGVITFSQGTIIWRCLMQTL